MRCKEKVVAVFLLLLFLMLQALFPFVGALTAVVGGGGWALLLLVCEHRSVSVPRRPVIYLFTYAITAFFLHPRRPDLSSNLRRPLPFRSLYPAASTTSRRRQWFPRHISLTRDRNRN